MDKFSLVEVLLDHDVNERILSSNDHPLQLIRKLRKVNCLFDFFVKKAKLNGHNLKKGVAMQQPYGEILSTAKRGPARLLGSSVCRQLAE